MRNILLAAFMLLVLVQWFVPGKMIWNKEQVVQKGKVFRFETEPVDPADPFRGRYITLNFKIDTFRRKSAENMLYDQLVYVLLENDARGFARIRDVVREKPSGENDYVLATAFAQSQDYDMLIYITYPFTEFYLDEYKAPQAEEAYRQSNRDSTLKTYALVKVLNGDAVIENVFVNDKPLVK